MFKVTVFIGISVFVSLNAASDYAYADEKLAWFPNLSGEVAFETKYIWRGQNMVGNPVIQPGASAGFKGFTFSVWGNYDTGSLDRFTEWDYIFDYTISIEDVKEKLNVGGDSAAFLDPLNVSLGYTYYTFPNLTGDAEDTHEPYVGLSYDVLLQPFVNYYVDVDTGSGSYWEFGVNHAFRLPGDMETELGITAGYNAGQWGYGWSFSNLLFSGEVMIPVFKYFSISPNVNYSLALDEEYHSEFYAGVKAGIFY